MRQGRDGLEEEEKEIIPGEGTFSRWDRQERALEGWARNDGSWTEDVIPELERLYGKEIASGSEARVFRYDGTHVVKAISSPFFQQETLDRISLTNFIFPQTGYELLGMGRDSDGTFCFVVKQPFIQGEPIGEEGITIQGLEDFREETITQENGDGTTEEVFSGSYISDYYILGDLHDRNVLRDINGNIRVVDCNLFLNTVEMGRGGKWVIPEVEAKEIDVLTARAFLYDNILPRKEKAGDLLPAIEKIRPGITSVIISLGYTPEPLRVRTKNGKFMEVVIQKDPADESNLLWNTLERIGKLARYDDRFNEKEISLLSRGVTVKKGNDHYRFDLHRGRVECVTQLKLRNTISESRKRERSKIKF